MTNQALSAEFGSGKVCLLDGELFFECKGNGAPVVLIHAGFSDRRDWKNQIEEFGTQFKTIVYDQRGAGNSSVPTSPFWPADDLKALLDHLGISKTTLVGHSVGGTVALDFALQYPDRVSALVLVAPGMSGFSWSKEYKDWETSIMGEFNASEMSNRALSAHFYARSMANPEIKKDLETITLQSILKVLTWKSFDIRCFDLDPMARLKEIQVP